MSSGQEEALQHACVSLGYQLTWCLDPLAACPPGTRSVVCMVHVLHVGPSPEGQSTMSEIYEQHLSMPVLLCAKIEGTFNQKFI